MVTTLIKNSIVRSGVIEGTILKKENHMELVC